jgi:Acetyltransferase (GNAT) family
MPPDAMIGVCRRAYDGLAVQTMALEVRCIDPREMRAAIVDFFWRIRMWPHPTKDHYFRLWDWRYASLSEQNPLAWVALDGTTVVGHITVLFRTLALNGQRIRAGITANYRVDEPYRSTMVGSALASAPRTLVRQGELDVLLAFSNLAGSRVVVALGYRELGPMCTWAQVTRWAPLLRRRSRFLTAFAPLVSAAARAHRRLRGARTPRLPEELTARVLSANELVGLDRSHWEHPRGLTWDGTIAAFANHFSPSEFRASRVLGVIDRRSGRLEGLVALEGVNDLQILECSVNDSTLSAVQAVELAVQASPGVESVRVPLLPQTNLAAAFRDAGYLQLPTAYSAAVLRGTLWSAYWAKEHPLATALADTRAWNLWYGWSHH